MTDREEKPCVGCGEPTTGMCWTDCGMSLCGAPLCKDCRHVDEKYGWRHEPRLKQGARNDLHEDREEAADRIEELEHDLKEAVRALQIARVHVANNECGWSVSRTDARFDLGVIDHIMEKIGASYD